MKRPKPPAPLPVTAKRITVTVTMSDGKRITTRSDRADGLEVHWDHSAPISFVRGIVGKIPDMNTPIRHTLDLKAQWLEMPRRRK